MSPPDGGDYFTVDGERPALVAPGVYSLRYEHYETGRLHAGRAGKVIVWFSICDYGPHFGQRVARYYNAKVASGKRRRGGKFNVGWKSDLLREFARVEAVPARSDRIRLDLLKPHLLEGKLATVMESADQKPIPRELQYSVVEEITGVRQRGA
jgi:hypothetical protein